MGVYFIKLQLNAFISLSYIIITQITVPNAIMEMRDKLIFVGNICFCKFLPFIDHILNLVSQHIYLFELETPQYCWLGNMWAITNYVMYVKYKVLGTVIYYCPLRSHLLKDAALSTFSPPITSLNALFKVTYCYMGIDSWGWQECKEHRCLTSCYYSKLGDTSVGCMCVYVCVSVHPPTCISMSSFAIREVNREFLSWQGICKF